METLYIIGESRTNADNAITQNFGSFFIAFEIDPSDGTIVNFSCTHTIDLTEDFLRRIFKGKSIESQYEQLAEEIARRYHGSSAKAVLASLKDASKRYLSIKQKLNLK